MPAQLRNLRIDRVSVVWLYLFPGLLSVLCYINGLPGDFVHDDIFAIRDNPDATGRRPISHLFRNDFWGRDIGDYFSHKSYRPLCILSFRLDYYLSNGSPAWFHAVNIVLHTCVTVALTVISRKVLHTSNACALLTGCLFAVHPIHTEAVTGLVGRAEILAALAFLLSFYLYSRCISSAAQLQNISTAGCRSPAPTNNEVVRQFGWLLISLLLAAVAMLCKEMGVTVLGICLVLDVLSNPGTVKKIMKGKLKTVAVLCFLIRSICLLLWGSLLIWFRLWIMNYQQPQSFTADVNPASSSSCALTRILTFAYLPVVNIWLLLFPANLCYDWTGGSIPLLTTFWDCRNLVSLVMYCVMAALVVVSLRRMWKTADVRLQDLGKRGEESSLVLFSVCIMIITFLPASNIFFHVGFVVAERVLYIPSIGYCLLTSQAIMAAYSRLPHIKGQVTISLVLMLLAMTARTVDRNRVWLSRQSLYRSGLQTMPFNEKIYYNWANSLKDEGKFQEAEAHYRMAIRLNPGVASYHVNLANVLANKSEAQLCYTEALRINPRHTGALVNMGILLINQEKKSGVSLVRQALVLDPNHFEAVLTMAHTLLVENNLEEAATFCSRALNIQPNSAKAHLYYGIYLHNSGRSNEALEEYSVTLSIEPNNTSALLNSGRIHLQNRHITTAKVFLERAVGIDATCSQCFELLGSVYMAEGNYDTAIRSLELAISSDPVNLLTNLKYVTVLKNNHQLGKASLALQEILNKFPQNLTLLQFAFKFYMEHKNYTQALHHIRGCIRIVEETEEGSLSSLYRDLGEVYRLSNDSLKALQSYEKAIQLNATNLEAVINTGSIYYLHKNYSQAEKFYKKALSIDQNNSLALLNLAKLKQIVSQDKA